MNLMTLSHFSGCCLNYSAIESCCIINYIKVNISFIQKVNFSKESDEIIDSERRINTKIQMCDEIVNQNIILKILLFSQNPKKNYALILEFIIHIKHDLYKFEIFRRSFIVFIIFEFTLDISDTLFRDFQIAMTRI